MQQELLQRIQANQAYQELVRRRSRFGWTLSIVMLVIYYSFILVIAFNPGLLGTPLSETSVITWGIPIGILIILVAFILTGIYVRRANREFDVLVQQIVEDVK
ncbi:MAG: DUF485 domain-containing protein [Acidihalobacter sp.]|uniref:DUF485 domain-containing protein n=1 Tax=Acidihalobacter sp. TaxID=1872108 RepID=UPI00307CEB45